MPRGHRLLRFLSGETILRHVVTVSGIRASALVPSLGSIIVFGGSTFDPIGTALVMYQLDTNNVSAGWSVASPDPAFAVPGQRFLGSAVWNAAIGGVVLFGGMVGLQVYDAAIPT